MTTEAVLGPGSDRRKQRGENGDGDEESFQGARNPPPRINLEATRLKT